MQLPLSQLFMIFVIQLVGCVTCSEVVCTKWYNDIPLTSEEINTIINYLGDILPSFNNASTGLNVTNAVPDYEYHEEHKDLNLNITEIISNNGYKSETKDVVTNDGYILRLVRIVGEGPPVFLMHGILSSAADWVTPGKGRALALVLADLGYDVWLGNARGNFYGRRHLYLSPDCKEFWNFTWHEIGIYDLPAMIDHVLKETKERSLYYIGHSQGTTSFFVMASLKTEYNKKIKKMVGLSGIAWMSHIKSPLLRLVSPVSGVAEVVLHALGIYEFLPRKEFLNAVTTLGCGTRKAATALCNNILFLLTGFDYPQVNSTYLPLYYKHFPSGCALKQLIHYAQEILSGHFRQFDHGTVKNLEVYSSEQPPDYPVENIITPVYLLHAENDWLSSIMDVRILIGKLRNFQELYVVPFPTFNHLDYLIANDLKVLVHDKVISILKEQYVNVNVSSISGHQQYSVFNNTIINFHVSNLENI